MSSGTNSYSLGGNNFQWFPNVIGNPKLQNRGPNQWFNEAAFAAPAPGTFGDERRNQLTGPGFERVNLGLGKTFHFTEGIHLEVRADANNAFNHPAFGLPNTNLTVCPSSGMLPAGCSRYGAIATGTSTITGLTDPVAVRCSSARMLRFKHTLPLSRSSGVPGFLVPRLFADWLRDVRKRRPVR